MYPHQHELDSITTANHGSHATLNATLQHESLIGPQRLCELAVPNTTMSVPGTCTTCTN